MAMTGGFAMTLGPPNAATPFRPAPRPARVLVLDDDLNMREVLSETLLLAGYDVETAESLANQERLLSTRWDAAIVDVRLGKQSGLDFLNALRARQPDVVALVLTGFSTPDVALSALRAGADDYFGKPVDLEKLKLAIRRGLERLTTTLENRALAQDLRSLHDQLRQARSLLQRRGVTTFEEGAAYLGILTEGAAREIRGPLAAVRTSLNVVLGAPGMEPRSAELVEYAIGEAGKIERTVSNLVSLIRPGREAVPTELSEIAEHAMRFTAEEMARKNVVAVIEPGEEAWISADRSRILRALVNVLLASLERMPSGGRIAIRTHADRDVGEADCEVTDTGTGIPTEEIEAVFEPFNPRSPGGLGLPAARAIVEEINGRIWAENRAGQGCAICIRLPLVAEGEDRGGLRMAG
jgi:signal transduction histidine kinase